MILFSNPDPHHEQVAPAPRALSSAAPESRIRSASVAPQHARFVLYNDDDNDNDDDGEV